MQELLDFGFTLIYFQAQAGELLMGVYVNNKDGHAVTLKVHPILYTVFCCTLAEI